MSSRLAVGHIVVLPDGSRVEDPTSETGYLMSPVPDLTPVAASGRQLRKTTEDMMQLPDSTAGTLPIATWRLWKYLGHGGEFDYQRQANPSGGWFQYPQFRNVSNFNVGLLGHQAGISLETLLGIAGGFSTFMGKPDFTQPHWLKKRTEDFIRKSYAASESGAFDPPIASLISLRRWPPSEPSASPGINDRPDGHAQQRRDPNTR